MFTFTYARAIIICVASGALKIRLVRKSKNHKNYFISKENKTMKKTYETPEITIVNLSATDIVTTSGQRDPNAGEWEDI